MLDEIIERITSPDKLSVFIFTLGFFLIVAATGIIDELKFLGLSTPSPRSKRGKIVMGIAGLVLLTWAVAQSLAIPVYKPTISAKKIYSGSDAKQIVADGEDVYLLKDNGNIFSISQNRLQQVDSGTGTAQISPAGGVLYILKNSGNIWSYVARGPRREDFFVPIDPGIGTRQIVSAGAALYILKENGHIWQYFARPAQRNMDAVEDKWFLLDDGQSTKQIASTGSILYVLKGNGEIWQYIPTHVKGFSKIYEAADEDKRPTFIAPSGGTLYFIKNDGSTWKFKEQLSIVEREEVAKEIDVFGEVLYILSTKGEIIRYNTANGDLRKLADAGLDNVHIAAFGQDIFAIKERDGGVWRYNEYIRSR
jgi:hypothetical protein